MKSENTSDSKTGFDECDLTEKRTLAPAGSANPALGPLALLPGTWGNIRVNDRRNDDGTPNPFFGTGASPLHGRGWNLIALPFIRSKGGLPYRVMMNQYNEVLKFETVDDKVPNRGIDFARGLNTDQSVAALDYTQQIKQIKAADDANSGKGLDDELPIHHEPGFFLHMKDQTVQDFTIARLATIPHGNAANAIGKFIELDGPPIIPDVSGLPEGASNFDSISALQPGFPVNSEREYLAPYKHFIDSPFKGDVGGSFAGFQPLNANHLIQAGLASVAGTVTKTTELVLDTDVMEGGIHNIPFIERQADAALMRSTFWILETNEEGPFGEPRLLLIYSQFIFLDFFQRRDGREGFIRWPHISINMMEKIAPPQA